MVEASNDRKGRLNGLELLESMHLLAPAGQMVLELLTPKVSQNLLSCFGAIYTVLVRYKPKWTRSVDGIHDVMIRDLFPVVDPSQMTNHYHDLCNLLNILTCWTSNVYTIEQYIILYHYKETQFKCDLLQEMGYQSAKICWNLTHIFQNNFLEKWFILMYLVGIWL
jgi:hypothetical protein